MSKFLSQLPDVKECLEALIETEGGIDNEGNIIYSDEDETGNLR
jgi:hypothetical protein